MYWFIIPSIEKITLIIFSILILISIKTVYPVKIWINSQEFPLVLFSKNKKINKEATHTCTIKRSKLKGCIIKSFFPCIKKYLLVKGSNINSSKRFGYRYFAKAITIKQLTNINVTQSKDSICLSINFKTYKVAIKVL